LQNLPTTVFQAQFKFHQEL